MASEDCTITLKMIEEFPIRYREPREDRLCVHPSQYEWFKKMLDELLGPSTKEDSREG